MLSRLRGAIDARIAEEQARQRAGQDSLSRSNSAARRTNASPARQSGARTKRNNSFLTRSPDPSEFDAEFVIGDDDSSTRTSTPRPEPEASVNGAAGESDDKVAEPARSTPPPGKPAPPTSTELPTDVRVKLRRLDKLESRYQELLSAYRVAHARVLSIEPFEAALRENTPLTSISEPRSLTEYLNQLTLKGDMVVDELKRVTAERDDYKKRFEATRDISDQASVQKTSQDNNDPGSNLTEEAVNDQNIPGIQTSTTGEDSLDNSQKSPTTSMTSRAASIRGLFSPKAKPLKSPPPPEEAEEFFSFDNEVPKLEAELNEKQQEVEKLRTEINKLNGDLSVARESTESMVHSLEAATRELFELRDKNERLDSRLREEGSDLRGQIISLKSRLSGMEFDFRSCSDDVEDLEMLLEERTDELRRIKTADLAGSADPSLDRVRFEVLQGVYLNLKSRLKDAESSVESLTSRLVSSETEEKNAKNLVDFIDDIYKENEKWKSAKELILSGKPADFEEVRESLTMSQTETAPPASIAVSPAPAPAPGKKKNRKKKKGGKVDAATTSAGSTTAPMQQPTSSGSASDSLHELENKVLALKTELAEKDAAVERLHSKLKGEETLSEEIESLRDDLMNIGQEHVEAKDKVKQLSVEKAALEKTIGNLEQEIVTLKANSASEDDAEGARKNLVTDFEDLKVKAVTLETDLSAAQQLAAARFKDLTDLRQALQKIQPELKTLRQESAELKATREELKNKGAEVGRLERRQEDLRIEIKDLKSAISEKESEAKTLNQKISQETNGRSKAEQALEAARSDIRSSETQNKEAVEKIDLITKDLSKAQEELRTSGSRVRELDEQVSKLNRELGNLHDEIQLKTAQHASAQSLMNSMRDQTSELAMQVKEARERCESLEEELSDAQRLLTERTREGETMRRLLSEVELRAEHKVRDFKERLETAIEERDRAEDEANTVGRRRAREVEELKTKAREAERALRSAEEDREELHHSQKEWKRRREELEMEMERSKQELTDVKEAMSQLRDALDESEKQTREFDQERSELRHAVEEANQRLDKVRKTNKSLSEDLKAINANKRRVESGGRTPRSSIDSAAQRVLSPPSRTRNGSLAPGEPPTAPGGGTIDHVYLKNVLLQFLEQKDKSHQKQLIPVLGMLLHFDANDEQKWISAISSK
ncbi:Golgin imh1 [Ophidiomyces ophidiicola]|nr:Golgin imh1 [Ophidiomyces ophidiicola]KAI1922107.1 Golgin imh1 [Ophidiomyces ophidiicola]KAI2007491.1 Golgin imh1 [Ophidiomyces ophidiicola]KAI2010157.1 Golgin imh1 [Ophidiomyces ophidiicola]KAI2018413.1 Golgin imh1 [Ophidiomyces ophidiicola]